VMCSGGRQQRVIDMSYCSEDIVRICLSSWQHGEGRADGDLLALRTINWKIKHHGAMDIVVQWQSGSLYVIMTGRVLLPRIFWWKREVSSQFGFPKEHAEETDHRKKPQQLHHKKTDNSEEKNTESVISKISSTTGVPCDYLKRPVQSCCLAEMPTTFQQRGNRQISDVIIFPSQNSEDCDCCSSFQTGPEEDIVLIVFHHGNRHELYLAEYQTRLET
jgi:hypothetical protein